MTEEVCCLFLGSAAVLWKEKSRGLAWSLVLKFWRQEHKWLLWTWPWGGRKKETAAEFPILLSLPRYSGKEGRQGGGSWNLHFSPHRMPFCCFQLAPRRWRDQYRYFPGEGNKTGTCALVELLRISSSFWHSLMQRQGKNSPGRELLLPFAAPGEKGSKWKLGGEGAEPFTPPTSEAHK